MFIGKDLGLPKLKRRWIVSFWQCESTKI